ncbi:hypothetical protein OROGR_020152 [Orobanche gracilis]
MVDLTRRHCFPVYWNGENRRVLRGHWFARKGGLDWLPLREDVAEQLEIAYRSQDELRQRKEEEMDDYCSQAPNEDHECSGGGYVNEHAKDSSGFWV